MRISTIICLYIFFGTAALHAQQKIHLDIATGYQREDFKWSIAGNLQGQSPNIYSELQWKKLGGQTISANLQWNFSGRLMLIGAYSRTSIRTGTVRDNDYNGDNRTNPAYDELFDADKGFTRDIVAGLGYRLIQTENFSLTPYVGYNISKQSLHLLDRSGQFPDLNSTYDTDWKGPFVKAIGVLKISGKLSLNGNIQYTQANYNAKADWNLISSFQHPVSYRHIAKGYGLEAGASLNYHLTKNIAVNAGGGYYTWQTGEGIDELFLSSGGSEKTQLNGADRKGYRLSAGVVLSY
ncbi:hypothetical protein [Mucilaginibacter pedocola]|uniref:Protochlamydia outer membrane protein domain-containing protein n=1 Tax=Mucilaginibacter pedocola TaxID=1792845 RepID=A0A1S9P9G3_9SPHI|nr:hypothetical protein [Mucilaginibacter pedocola]OOQ57624.1 hypothetical protein BC343_12525 [Mucilaginibacter pedocola]